MLRVTVVLLVGVFAWGFASCAITCPDGNVCSDFATCCKTQRHGFSCCPYPKAVCCSDLAHCCPSGYRCDQASQLCVKESQSWVTIPMAKKQAASSPVLPLSPLPEPEDKRVPDQKRSSVVHCDNYYTCPDFTTCCRHPKGAWFCCPYSPGRCCLDGYHCCPYGYDCDLTYTHCVRRGLRYPFTPKQDLSSLPASPISASDNKPSLQEKPMTALTEASSGTRKAGVIRCDDQFYCSQGTTCCKGTTGGWNCCPYPLGKCCADGRHCCEYGYSCDPSFLSCRKWYSQIPSGTQKRAKTY